MSKLWVVASKEYREVVQKKSFVVGLFLTPLLMAVWGILPTMLLMESATPTQSFVIVDFDNSGLAEKIQGALGELKNEEDSTLFTFAPLERFAGEKDPQWARRRPALDSLILTGKLDGAMLVTSQLLYADSINIISKKFKIKAVSQAERCLRELFTAERLALAEVSLPADSIRNLTKRIEFSVVTPSGQAKSFFAVFFGMLMMMILFMMMVMGYGQTLMRSVLEEKTSRITEVVISSVSPFQLMFGKIIGMGLAAWTQMLAWGVMGLGLRMSNASFISSPEAQGALSGILNPVFMVFFFLFVTLGFLLYSTLFAAIGAISTTDKDAQNLMTPVIFLLVAPFVLASALTEVGESGWMVWLSLFPFLAPSLMIMRISVAQPESFSLSDPIILQAFAAVAITALAVVGMSWVVARIFRIGILMYGKRPTLPEIWRWIRRK